MLGISAILIYGLIVACSGFSNSGGKFYKLDDGGLKFEIKDIPGATLAAVHYNINSPFAGLEAGQWNFDIRKKTGNVWEHENHLASVNPGDTVYYWTYMIVKGAGQSQNDLKWTVPDLQSNSSNSWNSSDTISPSRSADRLAGRKLTLVLDEDFNEAVLDKSKWKQEVTLSGGGNNEFQAYTTLTDNTFTKDGKLYIKPTLTADKYGEAFLTSGKWDLKSMYGSCTQSSSYGCLREGKYGMLPPVLSGRLESYANITYGRMEIVAKLPRGDWIWPAMWLLPRNAVYGGWPRSGEIDLMESRGNRKYGNIGVNHFGATLHWGTEFVNRYEMTFNEIKAKNGSFADKLYTYTFDWDRTGMDLYIDGENVVTYNTPPQGFFRWGNLPGVNIWDELNAPFNQPFYLILNVAVGGTNGYFPDSIVNEGYSKPWNNSDSKAFEAFWKAKSLWYPTWKGDDAAMQIDSIKMWQLE